MFWIFSIFVTLLALVNQSAALVSSQVIVRNTESQANCSGIVVSPNLVLTSAQCAKFVFANYLKVYTRSSERNPLNVSQINVYSGYKPDSVTNDVALLLLNGSTIITPAVLDTRQAHSTHCEANFAYGSPYAATSYNIYNCSALAYMNSTSCTNYTITDPLMCTQNRYKWSAERGTPVICNGLLTGIVSAIVDNKSLPQYCSAFAYITRLTPSISNWMSQVIMTNRPIQTANNHPPHAPFGSGIGPSAAVHPATATHPATPDHGHHGKSRSGAESWMSSIIVIAVAAFLTMGISV